MIKDSLTYKLMRIDISTQMNKELIVNIAAINNLLNKVYGG